MKEEYLHQIWRTKRLPMHQLVLTDGRKLNVLKTGWHNHESGPDFFNGSIEVDGIKWNGNIELHINSSDWYAHKHQFDAAYNNVILHVVYKYDKPVYINDEEIPTLELKSMLDKKHWSSYESLIKNTAWIPCASQISEVDAFFVGLQIENALIERLNRKSQALELRFQLLGRNLEQLQYETLAQAFGNKVNAFPFVELTQRMPIKTIWREGSSTAKSLLLGAAGFLQENEVDAEMQKLQREWNFYSMKHSLPPMDKLSWKFKGLRPPGFPPIRIAQFAETIALLRKDFSLVDKSVADITYLFLKTKENEIKNPHPITPDFLDLIIINAVVPFIWWYGNYKNDAQYRQKALDLLEQLKPEKNQIILSWKKYGIEAKSAKETQGLLELKNELCVQKKCLSCKIGNKILGKISE